jgi:hypothetical protein
LGECGERDRLREVVFDIGDDGPFLPGRKPAADLRFCVRLPGMKTYQFMCHQYAQGFDVERILAAAMKSSAATTRVV